MTKDPVCEMNVDEVETQSLGLTVDYHGQIQYFCSPQCKELFEDDPSHYLLQFGVPEQQLHGQPSQSPIINATARQPEILTPMDTSKHKRETTYDEDRVDEAALALLWLTTFCEHNDDPSRAWKGMAWEVIDRLEKRGYLVNSRSAMSLKLTDQGREQSEALFKRMFGKPVPGTIAVRPEAHEVVEEDGE